MCVFWGRQVGDCENHLGLLNCRSFSASGVKSCRAGEHVWPGPQGRLSRTVTMRDIVATLGQLGRAGLDCLETPNLVCISWGHLSNRGACTAPIPSALPAPTMFSKALFVPLCWGLVFTLSQTLPASPSPSQALWYRCKCPKGPGENTVRQKSLG